MECGALVNVSVQALGFQGSRVLANLEAYVVIGRAVQGATPEVSAGIGESKRSTPTGVVACGLTEVQTGFGPVVRTAIWFQLTDAGIAGGIGGSCCPLSDGTSVSLGASTFRLANQSVCYA